MSRAIWCRAPGPRCGQFANSCATFSRNSGRRPEGDGLSEREQSVLLLVGKREQRGRHGRPRADQKARGRYLGGKVPFGFRRGSDGDLLQHGAEQEAIQEMVALRAQGKALRAIAEAMAAKRP